MYPTFPDSLRRSLVSWMSSWLGWAAFCAGMGTCVLSGAEPAAKPAPATAALGAGPVKSPPLARKIVLIGGTKSHGPGEHDFPNGIPLLAAWLRAAPAFADVDVLAYTGGFPADLSVLDGASSVVLYFDGLQEKPRPLLDPARIKKLGELMAAGAGLVALHQASSLPKGDRSVPLVEWLGAKRDGMYDRALQEVTLNIGATGHPVSAGVVPTTYRDEFFPTLEFHPTRPITPILLATVTPTPGPDYTPPVPAAPLAAREAVVAWAFEREGGGRSFGFTGGHFLAGLGQPGLRQTLVNAIAWTARIDAPVGGVPIFPPVVALSSVARPADNRTLEMPWGELRWLTSAELGNSRTTTTGLVRIRRGQANPRHFHPNCDEVLHVLSGRIRHTMNEVSTEMGAGDTVSIPTGVLHNAVNIGDDDAVLFVTFSSAYREAVGY